MKGNILDISDVDFLFIWQIIRAEQCGNSCDGNKRLILIMEVKICTWPISTLLGGGGGDDGDRDWDVIVELPKKVHKAVKYL